MYSSKSASGRRCWTGKQRQRLLTRFHQSERTQRDFARRVWFRGLCEQIGERPVYLAGERKWAGQPDAGEPSAVIYTLLDSCRRHGMNPFEYLQDLFTRLPAAKVAQIKEFTPAAWARAKGEEKRRALAA